MSGKGKRKKQLKRTGGGSQSQSSNGTEKAEAVVDEVLEDSLNGNADQGVEESTSPTVDSGAPNVEVEKSAIVVSTDGGANGTSSDHTQVEKVESVQVEVDVETPSAASVVVDVQVAAEVEDHHHTNESSHSASEDQHESTPVAEEDPSKVLEFDIGLTASQPISAIIKEAIAEAAVEEPVVEEPTSNSDAHPNGHSHEAEIAQDAVKLEELVDAVTTEAVEAAVVAVDAVLEEPLHDHHDHGHEERHHHDHDHGHEEHHEHGESEEHHHHSPREHDHHHDDHHEHHHHHEEDHHEHEHHSHDDDRIDVASSVVAAAVIEAIEEEALEAAVIVAEETIDTSTTSASEPSLPLSKSSSSYKLTDRPSQLIRDASSTSHVSSNYSDSDDEHKKPSKIEVKVERPSIVAVRAARAAREAEAATDSTSKPHHSRVSSSSSASSVDLEDHRKETRVASSSAATSEPRSRYAPAEPFAYNTSTSDDEDDEETKKATERAMERRTKAKSRAEADRVEEELMNAKDTILSLKRRLEKAEGESESAKDEVVTAKDEAAQLKLELDLIRKKHADVVVFREESETESKKWRQRAEILQGELELVKFTEKKLAETAKALREAKDALEAERSVRDDLEIKLKASAHDREELIHAHQRELASAKRTVEVAQQGFDAQIASEREKGQEAIKFVKSKLKAQIRELELLLGDNRGTDEESRHDKRRLENQIRKLEEKLDVQTSERAKESRAGESAKRQLELLKDRVNKLTADKLDLETLVLQEKRKFDALEGDYDRATSTIRQLQSQLDQHKSLAPAKASRSRRDLSSPAASSSTAETAAAVDSDTE